MEKIESRFVLIPFPRTTKHIEGSVSEHRMTDPVMDRVTVSFGVCGQDDIETTRATVKGKSTLAQYLGYKSVFGELKIQI